MYKFNEWWTQWRILWDFYNRPLNEKKKKKQTNKNRKKSKLWNKISWLIFVSHKRQALCYISLNECKLVVNMGTGDIVKSKFSQILQNLKMPWHTHLYTLKLLQLVVWKMAEKIKAS